MCWLMACGSCGAVVHARLLALGTQYLSTTTYLPVVPTLSRRSGTLVALQSSVATRWPLALALFQQVTLLEHSTRRFDAKKDEVKIRA